MAVNIIGFGSSPSRCGPSCHVHRTAGPETSQVPMHPFARDAAFEPRQGVSTSHNGAAHVAFERMKSLGPCAV